jgi:hypothetical protein
VVEAAASAPPLRMRVPLFWQQHPIGSVEPDYLNEFSSQAASGKDSRS